MCVSAFHARALFYTKTSYWIPDGQTLLFFRRFMPTVFTLVLQLLISSHFCLGSKAARQQGKLFPCDSHQFPPSPSLLPLLL